MVWSSNRSGNHELYLLDLREGSVRRLTNNPAVDFFSRFSPDGRKIAFVRSQHEWVSARDPTAWDVYVIGVDGSGERRIAVGGFHPTWTADGTAVVFLRGTRLFRYDVVTGQESLVLDVANELPGIEDFGDAELAPDGRHWAFPLRGDFKGRLGLTGHFSGAVVLDPATRALVPLTTEQACQTTWAPDGQRLLWVETGGHGGTRVMTGRPDGTDRQVFMDLPGAYSHEYFPKFSNDGRWLIWGAAAEGHEHDRADYEIFAWEVGTPVERAVRLTHHPGNDQWPDLWIAPGAGARRVVEPGAPHRSSGSARGSPGSARAASGRPGLAPRAAGTGGRIRRLAGAPRRGSATRQGVANPLGDTTIAVPPASARTTLRFATPVNGTTFASNGAGM
jgi:Tol biopolymer transport system component